MTLFSCFSIFFLFVVFFKLQIILVHIDFYFLVISTTQDCWYSILQTNVDRWQEFWQVIWFRRLLTIFILLVIKIEEACSKGIIYNIWWRTCYFLIAILNNSRTWYFFVEAIIFLARPTRCITKNGRTEGRRLKGGGSMRVEENVEVKYKGN